MRRRLAIAGLDLEVVADNADRWRAMDALFGSCATSSRPPAITIEHGARAPALPNRMADRVTAEVETWLDDEGVATRHRSGLRGRRIGDAIHVGGPLDRTDPVRAFRLATQPPLMDALGRHGRHSLHAASLERDGWAVLVLGGSGAGKSTFAFAGSRGGWHIVADDVSIVTDGKGARVSGFPKPVQVPSDTIEAVPPGSTPLANDERRRWALPAAALAARGDYPVRAVVMVGHAADAAEVIATPASPARLERLIASLPMAMPGATRAFFPVAAALSRLPAYAYLHAADAGDRVASVLDLLDRLTAEVGGAQ